MTRRMANRGNREQKEAIRGGNLPHYAVLFVLDATAPALWEEPQRARDLARLLAVLKRSQPGPYGAPNRLGSAEVHRDFGRHEALEGRRRGEFAF